MKPLFGLLLMLILPTSGLTIGGPDVASDSFSSADFTTEYGSVYFFEVDIYPLQLRGKTFRVRTYMTLREKGVGVMWLDMLTMYLNVTYTDGSYVESNTGEFETLGYEYNRISYDFNISTDVPPSIDSMTISMTADFREVSEPPRDHLVGKRPYVTVAEIQILDHGENPPPQISSPEDVVMVKGEKRVLNWSVYDDIPMYYEINYSKWWVDSGSIREYTSQRFSITYDLSTLDYGFYNITISVWDMLGQISTDTVNVKIYNRIPRSSTTSRTISPAPIMVLGLIPVVRKRLSQTKK